MQQRTLCIHQVVQDFVDLVPRSVLYTIFAAVRAMKSQETVYLDFRQNEDLMKN